MNIRLLDRSGSLQMQVPQEVFARAERRARSSRWGRESPEASRLPEREIRIGMYTDVTARHTVRNEMPKSDEGRKRR